MTNSGYPSMTLTTTEATYTRLSTPVIACGQGLDEGEAIVLWTTIANADGYIFRYASTEVALASATTTSTISCWTMLTGIDPGETFYFQVMAIGYDDSLWSPAKSATMPAIPKDGKDGLPGLQGTQGPPGPPGLPGKDGADGEKGDKGDTGEKGADGAKGDKGDKGDSSSENKNRYIDGRLGVIQHSRDKNAVYRDFFVKDLSGNILYNDDLSDMDRLSMNWGLLWNHWDDGIKPVAAKRLDAMGWHPGDFPNKKYFDDVKNFRKECREVGFNGEFFCNEVYAGAAYPPGATEEYTHFRLSDIREAKYYARSIAGHSSLNIQAGPCHVNFSGFPHPQSLCRTTVPSQAAVPNQPKPSYYALRNIGNIMDDFYEADYNVELSDETDIIYFTLKNAEGIELLITAWVDAELKDPVTERKTDIILPDIKISRAEILDSFNGTQQELIINPSKNGATLRNILIKDYPVFIRLVL